ncbi:MAG: secretin N-terminal domain-containing protein [candidate division WOR-3 bacterium]|jgi:type IV pilus assembly protein PilQ
MKNKITVFLTAILFLGVLWTAQAQVAVKDVAIDKLLDEVRVTVACGGTPNISSFVSQEPPAVVVDIMDAVSQVAQERISSSYYPVTAVTVKPSEATSGVRVTVLLHHLVRHRITNENGVITISLGTQPLPPPPLPAPEDQFSGKPPLTLLVQDAEVTSVLRMLARQFDLNLMITQDVKSIVSVRLNQVPLRAGLEALVKAAGCNIVEDRSGVLIVKPVKKEMYGELQTRVFELDYVEAGDVIKAIKKALSPAGEAVEGYRRVGTQGGGFTRSGVLIVSDVPEALDEVAKIIAELDRPMPQIAIEAKFIETTHSYEDRWGIDWRPVASFGTELPKIGEEVALPVIVKDMLLGKISFAKFTAALEVLSSRGRSRVLANPRTVTTDNQTAMVSMGLDIPIREVHKDPNTGEITYTWKTRSVPIQLEVTPHVTSDGMITMHVKPSVQAITGWVGSADDRQPIVAKREAETQVKLGEDEVVVIGGLVRDEETRTVGKIPLLGDIPILGHLFKKTAIERTKSDLMIFIIPHIINPEG